MLFVLELDEAELTFVDIAATLDHALFVSSHTDFLTKQGVLGESWRLSPPHPLGRRPLHDLGPVQTSPSARPERFL